jgi:hypothetical protein
MGSRRAQPPPRRGGCSDVLRCGPTLRGQGLSEGFISFSKEFPKRCRSHLQRCAMPLTSLPAPHHAPARLLALEGPCGLLAAWCVLRHFGRRTSAERLIEACGYTRRYGVFTIGLATALREHGLDVSFHSAPDSDMKPLERRLYHRAHVLQIPVLAPVSARVAGTRGCGSCADCLPRHIVRPGTLLTVCGRATWQADSSAYRCQRHEQETVHQTVERTGDSSPVRDCQRSASSHFLTFTILLLDRWRMSSPERCSAEREGNRPGCSVGVSPTGRVRWDSIKRG